jgi:hypothetical protein
MINTSQHANPSHFAGPSRRFFLNCRGEAQTEFALNGYSSRTENSSAAAVLVEDA